MTGPRRRDDYSHQPRRDSMYEEHVADPYRARGKWQSRPNVPNVARSFITGDGSGERRRKRPSSISVQRASGCVTGCLPGS